MTDARRFAPATERNREPILAVLRDVLPARGLALEVASGTGEHAVHFARAFPGLEWQPTDLDDSARASIDAWAGAEGPGNIRPALALDAGIDNWPVSQADAMLCINMIHISPWAATEGLMRGAGRILPSGAPLFLYGPYRRTGHELEPSNAQFELWLKGQDERFGIRRLDDVAECAARSGLELERVVEMPANNLSVVFRRG